MVKKTLKKIKLYKKTMKRKIKGGAKTLNEVVSSLKAKGKYNEWVSKGSSFTYRWPNAELNYTFINIDGKPILGAYQGKKFRNNVESIPIFGQIEDLSSFVHQGNFRIVNENQNLKTTGLATCSGLTMRIGKKKFLTHLDATTNIDPIIEALNKTIKNEGIKEPTNVTIYAGGGFGNATSDVTIKMAKQICNSIGISEDKIRIKSVCFMTNVTAN